MGWLVWVGVEADSWLDRTLADLNKDDLKAVVLGDISLSRKEEDKEKVWLLDGATKEETEQEAVDKLLNKVTAISVQSVLDPATSAELFTKDPVVQFTVTKEDDSKVTYAFAENDEDDYFILKMSNNELYFKVGKWLVDDLTEAKREKLLKGYEEKKEETPAVQPVTQPVTQEAPLVDVPEQNAEQEAGLPEVPAKEEAAPVQNTESAEQEQAEAEALPETAAETVVQSASQPIPAEGPEQESLEPAEPEQQDVQAVEQNAGQEAVSEELLEQEQRQEDVQQNLVNDPVDDSGVEESTEQKQESVPEEKAAE